MKGGEKVQKFFVISLILIFMGIGPPVRADSTDAVGTVGFTPNPALEELLRVPENKTTTASLPNLSYSSGLILLPKTGESNNELSRVGILSLLSSLLLFIILRTKQSVKINI